MWKPLEHYKCWPFRDTWFSNNIMFCVQYVEFSWHLLSIHRMTESVPGWYWLNFEVKDLLEIYEIWSVLCKVLFMCHEVISENLSIVLCLRNLNCLPLCIFRNKFYSDNSEFATVTIGIGKMLRKMDIVCTPWF